jgi:putative ABC transport system permease protein
VVAAFGERFGRILPAVRTAVAYPLSSKFRTGMTMAMIGLITFALVAFAAINSNFAAVFLGDSAKGGWDIQVLTARTNRIDDFAASLRDSGVDQSQVAAVGENVIAWPDEAEVENRDRYENDDGIVTDYLRYTVMGADDAFLANANLELRLRARGYDSDEAVWRELANGRGFAVIPSRLTASEEDFGPQIENLLHLEPLEDGFEPFTLALRDPASGTIRDVTVIGQAKDASGLFWEGIILRKADLLEAYPKAEGQIFYIQLEDGVNSRRFAKDLEAGLLTASVESIDKLLDEQRALQNGFLLVFQGFMGLGLIVGIAALGVVASRAVVERRQQIGMLRAIGYQRSMVALSFLFESGFIALAGILIGFSLGLSLAWVLFTTEAIGEESVDVAFTVPWAELGVIVGLSFFASMIMTFLPARQASRVPVAEALRYE